MTASKLSSKSVESVQMKENCPHVPYAGKESANTSNCPAESLFYPKLFRQSFNSAHDSFKRKQVLNFSHLPGTSFIPTVKSIGQIDPTASLSNTQDWAFISQNGF